MVIVDAQPTTQLTTREREVLRLMADGLLTKQIAGRLGISEDQVSYHRKRVLEKLGVQSTIEAIRYAIRAGWIRP